jgi:hypothetical protein
VHAEHGHAPLDIAAPDGKGRLVGRMRKSARAKEP